MSYTSALTSESSGKLVVTTNERASLRNNSTLAEQTKKPLTLGPAVFFAFLPRR